MGGTGAVLEPAIVLFLLFGGCWVNRNRKYSSILPSWNGYGKTSDEESAVKGLHSPQHQPESRWRTRQVGIGHFKINVISPNTKLLEDTWLSQVVRRFPFLVEVLYWALIYWVYQLGRAFTAVTIVEGTVHVARRHALELIRLEQTLGLFNELEIQRFFIQYPFLMKSINSIYSFIHIPATIMFLVWLFWYTETSTATPRNSPQLRALDTGYVVNQAALYEARRRTMALCNLIAFIIFTAWPCMPPRLLSDPTYHGPSAQEAKSYGFVDTVHGGGQASVWTHNRFQNQYAAMPSLHFGYSLLVGLTIMTIPIRPSESRRLSASGTKINLRGTTFHVRLPSTQRMLALTIGFLYPFTILLAIVATANHFILDAVAGAWVCGFSWHANHIMLNLLPLRDWLFWAMRAHVPEDPVVMFENK